MHIVTRKNTISYMIHILLYIIRCKDVQHLIEKKDLSVTLIFILFSSQLITQQLQYKHKIQKLLKENIYLG